LPISVILQMYCEQLRKSNISSTFQEAPFAFQAAIVWEGEGKVRQMDRLHERLYNQHHPVESREELFPLSIQSCSALIVRVISSGKSLLAKGRCNTWRRHWNNLLLLPIFLVELNIFSATLKIGFLRVALVIAAFRNVRSEITVRGWVILTACLSKP